jgi:hypothetical protein
MSHSIFRLIAERYEQCLVLLLNFECGSVGKIDHDADLIGPRLAKAHTTHWVMIAGNYVARCGQARLIEIDHHSRGIAQSRYVIIKWTVALNANNRLLADPVNADLCDR